MKLRIKKIFTLYFFKKGEGFTLIEIMLAITIFVFIAIILNRFLFEGFRSLTFVSEQEEAIEAARDGMQTILAEIREANSSEKGHYALSSVAAQELVYYSDIDNDSQTEKIRYFLDDLELKKLVTEPGVNNDYDGESSTSTIASHINNQEAPFFKYYNADKEETTIINDIRLIEINLVINITPQRQPDDYWAISSVQLRNLKDNL